MEVGSGSKLYLYTDWTVSAWAKDCAEFRSLTKSKSNLAIRVCPDATLLPPGFEMTGELACDPIVRKRSQDATRSLVKSLVG